MSPRQLVKRLWSKLQVQELELYDNLHPGLWPTQIISIETNNNCIHFGKLLFSEVFLCTRWTSSLAQFHNAQYMFTVLFDSARLIDFCCQHQWQQRPESMERIVTMLRMNPDCVRPFLTDEPPKLKITISELPVMFSDLVHFSTVVLYCLFCPHEFCLSLLFNSSNRVLVLVSCPNMR